MINISLDDDDEIKIGSRVKFINKLHSFAGYHSIDTTGVEGTVLKDSQDDNMFFCSKQSWCVKFDDDSFLPSKLKGFSTWWIRKDKLELELE